MQLEEGVLTLSEPVTDEQVEDLKQMLAQAKKIIIQTHDLGGAVIQQLLCASQQAEIVIETESTVLPLIFEHPCFTAA